MKILRIVLFTFILSTLTPFAASAFTDEEICSHAAKTASFAIHSRVEGTPLETVNQINAIVFPALEYPESAAISEKVTDWIYSLPISTIESFKPLDQEGLIGIERGTFQRCMEEWR